MDIDNIGDIFNRPPDNDDYVEYFLYFPEPSSTNENNNNHLHETCTLVLAHIQQQVEGYIWQREAFSLSVTQSENKDPPYAFLHGKTKFGDCIDDEWFIVSLLLEISKKFLDVVISVSDSDGEFLLIEAALVLPPWINPSNSQNRVYIHKNALHIIPLPSSPAELIQIPPGTLTRTQGIKLIRSNVVKTESGKAIQDVALERCRDYPGKARQNFHRAKVVICKEIAYLLRKEPQLMALAVDAFYTRDPVSMKVLSKMEKFPQSNHPITTIVKFTKTLYAQMMGQRFYPPKSFHLPPTSSPEFKASELGMKLTCGFEMLYSDNFRANFQYPSPDTNIESYSFDRDTQWLMFKHNLSRRGYFQDELEGSQLYRKLNRIAQEQYFQNKQSSSTSPGFSQTVTPRSKIDHLLASYDPAVELPLDSELEQEDDEKWMEVTPEQVDKMLNERAGKGEETNVLDLEKIAENVERFVGLEEADIEGAVFPGEEDELSDEDYNSNDEEDDEDDEDVTFDPNEFMRLMQQTFNISEDEYSKLKVQKAKMSHGQPQAKTPPKPRVHFESESSPVISEQSPPSPHTAQDDTFETYMRAMDTELSSHDKLNQSFERVPLAPEEHEDEDIDRPVDVDLNLVRNLLQSIKAQEGLPGPGGNILGRLGLGVPKDEDEED